MSDKRSSLDSGCRHSSCITTVALPALILLLLIFTILASPTRAHAPADVKLDYNFAEQTLSVTVTHSVSTPDHYVKRIELKKNAELYLTRDYTSQPTTATFTYTYAVTAGDGDLLEATASCSLYGSKTERIAVAAPSSPSPAITPPIPTIIASTPSSSPGSTPSSTAPLTPLPMTPQPSAAPAPTPGFDVLFALSGLFAAIYLLKRRG